MNKKEIISNYYKNLKDKEIVCYFTNKLMSNNELVLTREDGTFNMINKKLVDRLSLNLLLNGYFLTYINKKDEGKIILSIYPFVLPKKEDYKNVPNTFNKYIFMVSDFKSASKSVAEELFYRLINGFENGIVIRKDMMLYKYVNETTLCYLDDYCKKSGYSLVDFRFSDGLFIKCESKEKKLKYDKKF